MVIRKCVVCNKCLQMGYLVKAMLSTVHFQSMKVEKAFTVAQETKKMIDDLEPDEKSKVYTQQRDGKLQ